MSIAISNRAIKLGLELGLGHTDDEVSARIREMVHKAAPMTRGAYNYRYEGYGFSVTSDVVVSICSLE